MWTVEEQGGRKKRTAAKEKVLGNEKRSRWEIMWKQMWSTSSSSCFVPFFKNSSHHQFWIVVPEREKVKRKYCKTYKNSTNTPSGFDCHLLFCCFSLSSAFGVFLFLEKNQKKIILKLKYHFHCSYPEGNLIKNYWTFPPCVSIFSTERCSLYFPIQFPSPSLCLCLSLFLNMQM